LKAQNNVYRDVKAIRGDGDKADNALRYITKRTPTRHADAALRQDRLVAERSSLMNQTRHLTAACPMVISIKADPAGRHWPACQKACPPGPVPA